MPSLMALMGLALPVPDHTTLARRRRTAAAEMNAPGRKGPVDLVLDSTGLTFRGPGEWDRLKHGERRRAWRKLHVAVDAGTARSSPSSSPTAAPRMPGWPGRWSSMRAGGSGR